ncbi:MAG: hypothetical protein WAS36_01100 [Candidatus Saccharimonadales bacterium]
MDSQKSNGFAVLGLLLVLVTVALIATTGWVVWSSSSSSSGSKTPPVIVTETAAPTPPSAGVIRITLVDSTSKEPLKNQDFEFVSQEDIQCVSAPCPTGEKRYAVRSNQSGQIEVPREYLQEKNTVVGSGYTSAALRVTPATVDYELAMMQL